YSAVTGNTMLIGAADFTEVAASDEAAIRIGFKLLDAGADGIYVGAHNIDRIKAMADAAIPVIGHVGLVPYRNTWFGGMRAVGKKADEALGIYERTMAYEEAGAISVEIEVVPHQMAAEISKRTKMIVISMGAGNGCDGQYLFAEDILGTNTEHVPRHAKQYRNLAAEYDRIHKEMVDAFKEFKADVDSGTYPEPGHQVNGKESEYQAFMDLLSQK
ncbi:MAG: 3-methyl-2-oxobutanoate hydroxymethyltransferase, partial [Lentisphaeria bacterium]|nr:3-methyl-2-oxobutanoate hydroxymethyltransferase [Lentisphaeria bacterium]